MTEHDKARIALQALMDRIARRIANDRLVAALLAMAEERARARRQK